MKILFSPFSPYVRKCLVTAHELGLHDRLQLLPSNAHPVQRDREIIASNPLGKVPTFFADDGRVLYDSRVICEYLNDLADGKLFPAPGAQRWDALTLQSLGDGILDAALLARYEDVARPEPMRWPEWRAAQLDKAETSLAHLNARPALLEARVDIGTIAVGCALWYLDLRFADFAWRDRHPLLGQWYAGFGARPSMRAEWSL
ncbi:putative GST-like protein YibF [Variovorax sp. PBS-H4]|uniref:glutathione S-transferase n=1 Tax=Variovorax sp. PBS-H4 TaxID=434008 RepID=UPI0013184957|nr:glutathione S-transferase [Variovorax sp. PBS-H4]VTU19169.1 putative GST-like protein YibF [Variovorax sp. PBS-H4]